MTMKSSIKGTVLSEGEEQLKEGNVDSKTLDPQMFDHY